MNWILEYYQAIQNGDEIVGKWIRLLYEKIVKGIESGEYLFSQKKANKAIRFIETFCRHNKGVLAPKHLTLQLWQKALISVIFGVLNPDTETRQFREVFIIMGRKMGKTLLAAAIMTYEAYLDGEFGSELYCLAPKLEQADLVHSAFKFNYENEPSFSEITKPRKNDIYIKSRNTTIKKIAFNDKKSDGYNPQLVIADECAAWPGQRGLKQWEVLVSGTGARREPLCIAISSGGYENGGIFDELYARGTSFLLGNSKETRYLPIFYQIDILAKWDEVNEWRKALPGLGVSVPVQYIIDECNTAQTSLSKRAEFITKYCCVKQSSSSAWLPADVVESACGDEILPESLSNCYAIGGLDLSQTTDLTAAVCVVEKEGKLNVLAKFWLPAGKLNDAIARDNLPYEIYIQRGLLELSGDAYIDYTDCYKWFVSLVEEYHILPLVVGFDRYSSQYLTASMEDYGFKMDSVYQGDNLYSTMLEFDGLLREGKIDIGNNDLLKIHLLNSALKMDNQRGRGRLIKLNPNDHIDGAAALLDAFAVRSKWYREFGSRLKNED